MINATEAWQPELLLPLELPSIFAWTGVQNTNYIQVSSGASVAKIPMKAVSNCFTGGGGGVSGQTAEFGTLAGGRISVLGLLAKADGTRTTIPVLGK